MCQICNMRNDMKRAYEIEERIAELKKELQEIRDSDCQPDGTVISWEWRGYTFVALKKVNKWWTTSNYDQPLSFAQLMEKYLKEATNIQTLEPNGFLIVA